MLGLIKNKPIVRVFLFRTFSEHGATKKAKLLPPQIGG